MVKPGIVLLSIIVSLILGIASIVVGSLLLPNYQGFIALIIVGFILVVATIVLLITFIVFSIDC